MNNKLDTTVKVNDPNSTVDDFEHNYGSLGLGTIGHVNKPLTVKERKKAMQEFLKNKKWR